MYAKFDDTLVTGNEMIDNQHRELISRINDLLIKAENKVDKAGAVNMLAHLDEYTDYHFAAEEKLQEEIEYPGIEEHKKKHEELRRTVKELREMLEEEEGPTDAFVEQVKEKVVEWLYSHIQGFDRSIAEFKFMRDSHERI